MDIFLNNWSNLLKEFISTFTSDTFITDLARITLFPAEFGAFTSDRSNSAIDYIKTFDYDSVFNVNMENGKKTIKFTNYILQKIEKNMVVKITFNSFCLVPDIFLTNWLAVFNVKNMVYEYSK